MRSSWSWWKHGDSHAIHDEFCRIGVKKKFSEDQKTTFGGSKKYANIKKELKPQEQRQEGREEGRESKEGRKERRNEGTKEGAEGGKRQAKQESKEEKTEGNEANKQRRQGGRKEKGNKKRNQEMKKMNKTFRNHASTPFFSPQQDCGICVYVALVFTLCFSLCAIHTNPVSCCNSKAAVRFLK